jgi:hypothetical protein
MRNIVFTLALCALANGQSMVESGAVLAGTTIGSAAGKKLSDGVDSRLKKTGSVLDAAAKTGSKAAPPQVPSAPATPLLQVGAGVPKAEANNVPPPPPRRRVAAAKPAKARPVSVPIVMSAVLPQAPSAVLFNVDLTQIQSGMQRDAVLALGVPSARITMYEEGHLVETYQYRNPTMPSGSVRLRDGAVFAVQVRP